MTFNVHDQKTQFTLNGTFANNGNIYLTIKGLKQRKFLSWKGMKKGNCFSCVQLTYKMTCFLRYMNNSIALYNFKWRNESFQTPYKYVQQKVSFIYNFEGYYTCCSIIV